MKYNQGLAITAQNYLSTSLNSKSEYKCENCHLVFQTEVELYNHTKKFCTDSGFDTLAGLNIKLKNPTYGLQKKQSRRKFNDSLTNALEEIEKNKVFKPMEKELKNDLLNLQRYQEDIKYARPYMYGLRKNNDYENSHARKSRSLYVNGNDENDEKNNYGQKVNDNYENPQQKSETSKAYSFTSSYMKKIKESNAYVSPPSQLPLQENAKQFSLLDKSDMSIKMMPEQDKKDYVIRKILELEQIEEGYKKNGGKNGQFVENTLRMKKFYQELLDKINNQKDSMFGGGKISNGTRVSTPISRLEKLTDSRILIESLVRPEDGRSSIMKSKISEIQQKNIAKRQDQVKKRFHTEVEGGKLQRNLKDSLDDEILQKIASHSNSDKQNQIIVIPIQSQPINQPPAYSQQQQSYETELTMKYIESVSALKDEQNKNFLEILQRQNQEMKKMYETEIKNKEKESSKNDSKIKALENKYQKLMDKMDRQREKEERSRQNEVQNNFRISRSKNNNRRNKTEYSYQENDDKEYREMHPEIDNVRLLNMETEGYHSQQFEQLSQEERILIQMQKEERDELQLFAHLPAEIQKIKQKSIEELGEKRFEMEKELIKQKLEKLKLSEEMKAFELERRLLSEELENEKKKIAIHKLMRRKIKEIVREEFEEQDKEETYEDELQEEENEDVLRGIKSNNINLNKLPERDSQNGTPIM